MKRINLSVDLENNEIFDESLRNAVRDYAKQVAREEFERVVSSEISRIAESTAKSYVSSPYGVISQRFNKEVRDAVDKAILHPSFARAEIRTQLNNRLDFAESLCRDLLTRLENSVNEAIASSREQIAHQTNAAVEKAANDAVANILVKLSSNP